MARTILLAVVILGLSFGVSGDWQEWPWLFGGQWLLDGDQLAHRMVSSGDAIPNLQMDDWRSYTVSFRWKHLEFGNYGALRLMVRQVGTWEGIGVSFFQGQVIVFGFNGDWSQNTTLGSASYPTPPPQGTLVEVELKDQDIQVRMDGRVILTVRDRQDQYPTGGFSFRVSNAAAILSEISVSGAPLIIGSLDDGLDSPLPPERQAEPRLSGTFLQPDQTTGRWNQDLWNQEFQFMKDLGMDLLILQWSRIDGRSYHWELKSDEVVGHGHLVDYLFGAAEATGIQVMLGTSMVGERWWRGLTAEGAQAEIRENIEAMEVLAARYGNHPNFAGWYIPHELHDGMLNTSYTPHVVHLMEAVTARARELTPGKPVAIAPYFSPGASVDMWERNWRQFLSRLSVDIVMLQDGVGVDRIHVDAVPRFYAAMARISRDLGFAFWNDLESFRSNWAPAPTHEILRQIEVSWPYVEKIVIFEFNHYQSPLRGRQREYYDLLDALNP